MAAKNVKFKIFKVELWACNYKFSINLNILKDNSIRLFEKGYESLKRMQYEKFYYSTK